MSGFVFRTAFLLPALVFIPSAFSGGESLLYSTGAYPSVSLKAHKAFSSQWREPDPEADIQEGLENILERGKSGWKIHKYYSRDEEEEERRQGERLRKESRADEELSHSDRLAGSSWVVIDEAKLRQAAGGTSTDNGGAPGNGTASSQGGTGNDGSGSSNQTETQPTSLRELALKAAVQGGVVERTQEEVQSFLEKMHEQYSHEAALRTLYWYNQRLGYLPPNWLSGIEKRRYVDESSGITYRAEINKPRSEYSKNYKGGSYCKLCPENIGNAHRGVRKHLRAYWIKLNGKPYFLQPPPFPYAPMHFVLIQEEHTPMRVDQESIGEALQFISQFPGFTVCSNSHIEDAGATVPGHHHLQVFHNFDLPAFVAEPRDNLKEVNGELEVAVLDYPATVFRISSTDRTQLAEAAERLIAAWKAEAPGKNTVNYLLKDDGGVFRIWIYPRDVRIDSKEEFEYIKPEKVGFIDEAGHLLLAVHDPVQKPDYLEKLNDPAYMLRVIREGLAHLSPIKFYEEARLVTLIRIALGYEARE